MAALLGRHINKIDKKGRVSIPKAFRDAIAHEDYQGIYVYPSFQFPALEAAGELFIQRLISNLNDSDIIFDEQAELAATILENTQSLPYDPEGRVMLPKNMVDHVNLTNEAVFVGRGTRFQIWEPEAYALHNADSFDRVRTREVTLRRRSDEDEKEGGA